MNKNLKEFIAKIENMQRREDAHALVKLMEEESGYKGHLSGSVIGFGRYQYDLASGQTGESMVVGFSPRKQNTVVYIMPGFSRYQKVLETLGKYKTGKSCLYVNKLADLEIKQLRKLVKRSVKDMQKEYPCKNQ